jgi:hypothetical protein
VSALAIGSNGYVLKSDGTDAAWAADTDTALTTEQVQDIAGAMFSSNTETGIAATYQDGDGTIDLVIGDDTIVSSMLDTNIAIAGTLGVAGAITGQKLISTNGVLELDDNGSHNGIINVPASISINIDSDNGGTTETFTVSKNKTAINDTDPLFRVQEDGKVGIGVIPTHNFNLQSAGAVEARFHSTDNSCSLQISSDTDEGQNSELVFMSGTTGRGSILFAHHPTAASQAMVFKIGDNAVDALRIGGGGGIGMGTTTTAVPLTINLASDINWRFLSASSQSRLMAISNDGGTYKDIGILGSNTIFYQQGSERARIDSSGSLGLGTNNPGSLFHAAHSNGGTNPTARIENTVGTVAANSVLLDLKFSGDDSFSNCDYIKFQDSSGEEGVITGDGGSRVYYEINSDYRLKENITSYSGGLNIINALSVKKYNYIKSPGTNYTGFLAHEVAEVVDGVARGVKDATEVLSNVVLNHNSVVIDQGVTETEWTDGKTSEKYASNTTWSASHTRNINQGLDLSKLVPDLVSAIQEQQTIIDDLKSRIETLEG